MCLTHVACCEFHVARTMLGVIFTLYLAQSVQAVVEYTHGMRMGTYDTVRLAESMPVVAIQSVKSGIVYFQTM